MKLYDVIQKEHKTTKESSDVSEERVHLDYVEPKQDFQKRFRLKQISIFFFAAVFLVGLYTAGIFLVRAKVIITERRIPFILENAEFELVHEQTAGSGRLSFQTMVVESEASRQVYGAAAEQHTSYASGKVVFFNEYSTKPQTIKAKTTLTSTTGKKYQTTQAVTVPGFTTVKGKKTPGTSSSVVIKALEVGPASNTTGASFSVSGFGKTVYAQSAGAVSGGEDGIMHSVNPTDSPNIIATLQTQLIERLKRETRAQIPDTLITYPDLQVPSVDAGSVVLSGTSVKFPATMKGAMTTYLVPRDLFEMAIASHVFRDHTYPHITIPTVTDLKVVSVTPLPADPRHTPDSIRVRVSGEGILITKVPIDLVKQSLLGIPKKTIETLINSIPEIDTAQYHIYPFWAPFFPHKANRIFIEIK